MFIIIRNYDKIRHFVTGMEVIGIRCSVLVYYFISVANSSSKDNILIMMFSVIFAASKTIFSTL